MDQEEDPIELLRAGDAPACERFVHAYAEGLYGWLYRLTSDRDEAEDISQEAFAAFWASIRRKRPPVKSNVWLFSIARNLWRQHCRRAAGRPTTKHDGLGRLQEIEASGAASDALEREEMAEALQAAVAELTVEFREAFSLRAWQQMDYAEIAAVQGISPGLARWRFFRARQQLRDRLGNWFDDATAE